MQATRRHILDFLDTQRSATALEISRAFGMTAANIRHHLTRLEASGHVAMIGERAPEGRGRPEKRYALAGPQSAAPLEKLVRGLLSLISQERTSKHPATRLRQLARKLAGPSGDKQRHLTQSLVDTVKRLEELGYQPSWEATPGGPEFILSTCPYAGIVEQHPELCKLDQHLLEHLIGQKVAQTRKLELGPDGLPHCAFRLR